MRAWFLLFVLFALLAAASALAGTTVDQGAGSFGVTPWAVTVTAHNTAVQTEVLVLNSASTTVPTTALAGRRSIEVQNIGPNAIFCNIGAAAVVNKSRRLAQNEAWVVEISDVKTIRCIAGTADQVTGAATIATEVR